MHVTLFHPLTLDLLLQVDLDIETEAAQQPCSYCGDRLHRAYYKRSPRFPGMPLPDAFQVRPSFCCQRDGCRRRMTPTLTRFLGRKVYVSIVVLLVAAMTQGPSPKRLSAIKAELGISPHTVHRWCQYWKELFVKRNAWRYHRLKFMPPIDESGLPLTLLERLERALGDQFEAALHLLRLAVDCSLDPSPRSSQ